MFVPTHPLYYLLHITSLVAMARGSSLLSSPGPCTAVPARVTIGHVYVTLSLSLSLCVFIFSFYLWDQSRVSKRCITAIRFELSSPPVRTYGMSSRLSRIHLRLQILFSSFSALLFLDAHPPVPTTDNYVMSSYVHMNVGSSAMLENVPLSSTISSPRIRCVFSAY